jgi:hypothetical protein
VKTFRVLFFSAFRPPAKPHQTKTLAQLAASERPQKSTRYPPPLAATIAIHKGGAAIIRVSEKVLLPFGHIPSRESCCDLRNRLLFAMISTTSGAIRFLPAAIARWRYMRRTFGGPMKMLYFWEGIFELEMCGGRMEMM